MKQVKIDTTKSEYGADILKILPNVTNRLKLSSIIRGTDSFEFRFWLPKKGSEVIFILSLKCIENKWTSTISSFLPTLPTHDIIKGDTTNYFRQFVIQHYMTTMIKSDIDINRIVDSLAILDLQNSPTNADIEKGQALSTGPARYILEFADKNNYRVIHYLLTSRSPSQNEFDHKVMYFLEFTKRHFKIDI